MLYPNLKFPKIIKRPFFYTNFVQTVDGKVWVKKPGYWPIGSKFDHQVLLELRAYADCLIHGKNLYQEFASVTKKTLQSKAFKKLRANLGKDPNLPYLIGTHNLDKLIHTLQKKGYLHVLVEGGPTLLGSFLKMGLIDEIFLTIAPKIYGSKASSTKTLVEGYIFPSGSIQKLKLLSVRQIGSELFLRYRAS